MPLFESKEEKKARREVAIRMSKKKVQRYVGDCRQMSDKYRDLAKRAYSLGQQGQGDQYACRRIQYNRQAGKWDGFLLRMEDLALRGQMSGAMTGLMQGMDALTKEIRSGVSAKDMTRMVSELNVTMAQLGQAEEQLTVTMEGIDPEIGSPMSDSTSQDIPADMQEEVARMRDELMDEVVVQEKVGGTVDGLSAPASAATDDGIKELKDKIQKLKKGR